MLHDGRRRSKLSFDIWHCQLLIKIYTESNRICLFSSSVFIVHLNKFVHTQCVWRNRSDFTSEIIQQVVPASKTLNKLIWLQLISILGKYLLDAMLTQSIFSQSRESHYHLTSHYHVKWFAKCEKKYSKYLIVWWSAFGRLMITYWIAQNNHVVSCQLYYQKHFWHFGIYN